MNKKTAVILINWNSFQFSFNCITSLNEMNYRDFDIILVDNASADNSVTELTNYFPDIILIRSARNLGFAGGNNLGMEYAISHGYTYTLLLNNDTLVTPDFLELLVNHMEANPGSGAIQPKIFKEDNRLKLWSAGGYYLKSIGFTYTSHQENQEKETVLFSKPVDWISGCAFFIRTAVLAKTALFAPGMFMYFEDVDLSFQVRSLGFSLDYYPASVIYHIGGASGRRTTKGKEGFVNASVHYYNIRNRIWIIKKYTPSIWMPAAALANFFYIILLIAYFACRSRPNKISATLRGVKDGLRGNIIYNRKIKDLTH